MESHSKPRTEAQEKWDEYGWIGVTAVLTLILSGAASGAAFSIALAIEGVLLGLWAASKTVEAARDAKVLHEAVSASRTLIKDMGRSAASADQAAERLVAFTELQPLREVDHALRPLVTKRLWASVPSGSASPVTFTAPDRTKYHTALYRSLGDLSGLVALPACENLESELSPLRSLEPASAGTPVDRDAFDFADLIKAADAEIRREMRLRSDTLRGS